MTVEIEPATEVATQQAELASAACGIQIRPVSTAESAGDLAEVLDLTWVSNERTIPPQMLVALAHSGNYVHTAYRNGRAVGGAVGFFSEPCRRMLHSHVAAVRPGERSGGIGYALKLHQRAWAMARGIDTIVWTFDPLVARNAYFNIERLGADIVEYLPDFYGHMIDALNSTSSSDRVVISWPLRVGAEPGHLRESSDLQGPEGHLALAVDADGRPDVRDSHAAEPVAPLVLLQIPRDIEHLRETKPELDPLWRAALRQALIPLLGNGYRAIGFQRNGVYVLRQQ